MLVDEPVAEPADVGLSEERLRRIERLLWEDVAAGLIPGAAIAVARGARLVYRRCIGYVDHPAKRPMKPDAIFRLYSMTKPFLSVATLSLVEEGRLGLGEPVSRYLPALGNPRVARPTDDGMKIVPAEREPTIRDLLTHTSGFNDSPTVASLYKFEHTPAAFDESLDDLVAKLAERPLTFHPGTRWDYDGHSAEVLGKVLEVVTGEPLDDLIRKRVFEPLAMHDSGFYVEPDDADRIAEPLRTDGARTPPDLIRMTRRPRFLSGASGCLASLGDYLRFATMLLRRGELDGRRVLAEELADTMVSDHLGPLAGTDPGFFPGGGYGFGFGLAVRTSHGATTPGSIGDYYWLARASANFFVDPAEELVGVMMVQRFRLSRHYQRWFKTLVYQARVA